MPGQSPSFAEKLGYEKDAKLLIIHADDLGVSHSENAASIEAMESGCVNSASIMVPCPWFGDMAAYAKEHPEMDFGVHLTITSEWKHYKWKPVSSPEKVPSLIDENGFFYDNSKDVQKNATAKEIEIELRAQIELAKKFGINITHLDSHMFTLFTRDDFIDVYKKLGKEYGLPILINTSFMNMFGLDPSVVAADEVIVADHVHMALTSKKKGDLEDFYVNTMKNLKPGLNVILLHAAFDNPEMQAVTIDFSAFGAKWRQEDFDFFASETCSTLIEKHGIQLITWKEIKEKLMD